MFKGILPAFQTLKVIRTVAVRAATYDFLLTFRSIRGPNGSLLYSLQDMARYWSTIAIFPNPRLFNAPLRLFLLESYNDAWA